MTPLSLPRAMDSPSLSRSSHNDRLPAGSPAFVPRNRRLLVSKGTRTASSESEGGSNRCAQCRHLLMDSLLFCRNCGQRRSSPESLANAFGGIRDALANGRESRGEGGVKDREEQDGRPQVVLHSLEAVASVLQDMLQLKYGLVLDESDLLGKLRHHCNGSTPEEVVKLFNSQRDLHFRTPGCQRLVCLRIDWKPVASFDALQAKVRKMPGTGCAVAVLSLGDHPSSEVPSAAAIFRESYSSYPRTLMGHSAGASPLVTVTARGFSPAGSGFLEPQVLSELRTGPNRKPVECAAPCWRDEYSTVVKQEEMGACQAFQPLEPTALEQPVPPVPRLQLPINSGRRASRRTSPRRKEEMSLPSSARLTQCSTEASPRHHSPERPAERSAMMGLSEPWNLSNLGPFPSVQLPAAWQEPAAVGTWPISSSLRSSNALGLTPPNGLMQPQLTPRHLPFSGTLYS